MDGSIQRKGDRVRLVVPISISAEAARDAASSQMGLPREAMGLVAQQRLQDGTISYTFRLSRAAVPHGAHEATRETHEWLN